MSELSRHEYVLDLSGFAREVPADPSVRHPTPDDAEALAVLMLDAYLDTIDYDGESIVEAREEVARYLAGKPMLDCSWVRVAGKAPASALLVAWSARDCPMVSYVMTAPAWKGKGLAGDLLDRSLASLSGAGHDEVRAWITEGNIPSERAFARAGFRRV